MPQSSPARFFEDQFDPARDIAQAPAATKTLIIASTPRSGSHMLGHAMMETGAMGVPYEYGNPRNMARWRERLGTSDVEETLAAIMARRTTPNGVFAIKLHYAHLAHVGGLDRMLEFFPDPHVIHVHRSDLLRQALSFSRARQTDVWIDGMEGNGKTAVYDRAQIETCLSLLAQWNALWRMDLAERNVAMQAVEFDEMIASPPDVIRKIATCTAITLDPVRIPEKPTTRAQSHGGGTDKMIRRYAAEQPQRRPASLYRRVMKRLKAG